ncbi:MAG: hypothetical protein ACI4PR_04430 [Acutalibacteraceae bacterium]
MTDNINRETKSSTKAKSKYNKKAYLRTHISFKPLEMAILNMHCEKYGYSKNGFVVQAVKEKIERDIGKNFDEFLKENQPEQEPDNTEKN